MKVCSHCKDELDESEFPPAPSHKDGLGYVCRSCVNRKARLKHKPVSGVRLPMAVAQSKGKRQAQIAKYGIELVETMESISPYDD